MVRIDSSRRAHLESSQSISAFSVVGLPLLYASAYFLPPLGAMGEYLLPARDFGGLILAPSLVAVVVGAAIVYAALFVARTWLPQRWATVGAVLAVSVLTLVGLKGVLYAAGFDWQDKIPRGPDLLTTLRHVKYGSFCTVFLLVCLWRKFLPTLTRVLGSLGFAFAALAIFRMFGLWHQSSPVPGVTVTSWEHHAVEASVTRPPSARFGTAAPLRRVVWVLFDETDFQRVYEDDGQAVAGLTNFRRLARAAVFATHANSPASATLYSIPSLLAGVPLEGDGVRLQGSSALSLETTGGRLIPFNEAATLFGALSASGRRASVLGFLHPYCKLFTLERCDSFVSPAYGFGSLDAALWANIPYVVAAKMKHSTSNWEEITRGSLSLLPEYLARDDSLTFIHLNIPHLPAVYADQVLHMPASQDPLTEYGHNLLLTDRILGQIMNSLEAESSRQEIVLVVSTDHWLRNRWYRANEAEKSRPVPLLIWKVGDTNGVVVSNPVSTVRTGAMVLDYLNGALNSQAEIGRWWATQPTYSSFIAPDT